MWWKGSAPGCAHYVGAQRHQAGPGSGSSGHSQAMAGGTGKPTYVVQGWQLSWWLMEEQHPFANRHRAVSRYATYVETRWHCWGIQAERCCPSKITRPQKLQLSVFLPNNLSLIGTQGFMAYPTIFIPTDELDSDDNPALFNSLPESLRNLWGNILISTRYRYVIY